MNLDNIAIDDEMDKRKNRILIIDDVQASRKLLKTYLHEFGYECSEAEDGKKGLEQFISYDFDLVLLDFMMPVMDGMECIQKMRELDNKKHIPVLFLTGINDQESHQKCIEYGCNDFILKPYQEYILKIKLQSWLRIKKSMDLLQQKKQMYKLLDEQHEEDLYISSQVISKYTQIEYKKIKNLKILDMPEKILSGDISLSSINPSGHQVVLLGDFTGHGLPASIGSLLVSELFYTMTNKGFSIVEIAEEINRKLKLVLPVNRFMAACLLTIDFDNKAISVLQAGLPDILVFDTNNKLKQKIKSKHVPLGVLDKDELNLKNEQFTLEDNDKIFLFTDGIIESKKTDGNMYGIENVVRSIEKSSEEFNSFDAVIHDFRESTKGVQYFDDISFIQIICNSELIDNTVDQINQKCTRSLSEWDMSISFDINIMRETDPIPSLTNQIIEIQGNKIPREKLFIVLKELYSNSLEHGILGLDSEMKNTPEGFADYYELRQKRLNDVKNGKIEINIHHKPVEDGGVLHIRISDNGKGFDTTDISHYIENNIEYKGRGIGIVQSLTENYRYEDNGRKALVELAWCKAA